MSQQKHQFITLLVAIFCIAVANTYDCPEDCHCVVIKGTRPYNHAKCTSINGLLEVKNLPIHSIDLSHAGLTRISNHLEVFHDLDTIDLSYNQLSEVGRIGPRVRTLNLKQNKITSGKLSKISHYIQNLDLSNNEITYLPSEFKELKQLRTLELVGNHINCSCETLDVRNWLQEQHIYTENHIKCTTPYQVKGKPWLQVKQSEICEHEKQTIDDNENDLMMGDQPLEDGEDELGTDFMPVSKTKDDADDEISKDVEGSGDLSVHNMPLLLASSNGTTAGPNGDEHTQTESNDAEDDGSGSGMGPIILHNLGIIEPDSLDDYIENDSSTQTIAEPANDSISSSDDIFVGRGLGIAEFDDGTGTSENPTEVVEESIVPSIFSETETKNIENNGEGQSASIRLPDDNDVTQAKSGDDQGTYILLGIILLLIVGLIIFVAIKRKSRRGNHEFDAENQRTTELLDMDKKNPGKPVNKNGHTEQLPLIGNDKPKPDIEKSMNGNNKRIPYDDGTDKKIQEPLLQSENNGPVENESNNNVPEKPVQPTETIPVHSIISPRYPPPKSPRASKQNGNVDDDEVFLPSTQGRYSPVYSPETGKVKIKLTETPKPKTPMLVTRSKSNAGEIISIPVLSNKSHPEVHNNNNNHLTTNGDQNE